MKETLRRSARRMTGLFKPKTPRMKTEFSEKDKRQRRAVRIDPPSQRLSSQDSRDAPATNAKSGARAETKTCSKGHARQEKPPRKANKQRPKEMDLEKGLPRQQDRTFDKTQLSDKDRAAIENFNLDDQPETEEQRLNKRKTNFFLGKRGTWLGGAF